MKLKKKIIAKPKKEFIVEATVEKGVKLDSFMKFMNDINAAEKYPFGCISKWFDTLFEEDVPEDVPMELLKTRIQYELLKRDYEASGVKIPEKILQNYKASKLYDIEKFTSGMKCILEITLNQKQEEQEMKIQTKLQKPTLKAPVKAPSGPAVKITKIEAKVTPAAKGQTKPATVAKGEQRETVTQSYIRLFEENFKKKRTDKELAMEMRRLHPDKKKYTETDISTIRAMYNRGKLSGQKSKPKVELEAQGKK